MRENPANAPTIVALAMALVAALATSLAPATARGQAGDGSGSEAEAAIVEGTGAAAEDGGSVEALVAAALELRRAGDQEAAADLVLSWIQAHPTRAREERAATTYSLALRERSAFDEAEAFLARAVEADGDDPAVRFELATLQLASLRFAEAAEVLRPIGPEAREYTFSQGNLVTALFLSGDLEGALAANEARAGGRAALFAAATGCELALAQSGPEAARACLAEERARFGEHDAFFLREVYLDYRDGDAAGALARVREVEGTGLWSGRLSALLVLAPLATGDLDAAQAGVEAMQISVLGERSALRSLVLLARGDREGARAQWADAVERNPLFSDPENAGRVLLWDPSLAQGVITALGDMGESEGSGAPAGEEMGTDEPDAAATREDPPATRGCCATLPDRGTPPLTLWLGALGAMLAWRRRWLPRLPLQMREEPREGAVSASHHSRPRSLD